MPCVKQLRIPTAKAPPEKVAVSQKGGARPSLSEGRPSLTIREGEIKSFESQRCILHKDRNHSHGDDVAACGVIKFRNARPCRSAEPCTFSRQRFQQTLQWTSTKNDQRGIRSKFKVNKTSSPKHELTTERSLRHTDGLLSSETRSTAELLQTYTVGVVLRGDNVKDDTSVCAVFEHQRLI